MKCPCSVSVVMYSTGSVLTLPSGNRNQLIGGKIKKDENPISAIVREIKEETGFSIETERLGVLPTQKYFNKRWNQSALHHFFAYPVNVGEENAINNTAASFPEKKRPRWLPVERAVSTNSYLWREYAKAVKAALRVP